jgi:hypothetical protein
MEVLGCDASIAQIKRLGPLLTSPSGVNSVSSLSETDNQFQSLGALVEAARGPLSKDGMMAIVMITPSIRQA